MPNAISDLIGRTMNMDTYLETISHLNFYDLVRLIYMSDSGCPTLSLPAIDYILNIAYARDMKSVLAKKSIDMPNLIRNCKIGSVLISGGAAVEALFSSKWDTATTDVDIYVHSDSSLQVHNNLLLMGFEKHPFSTSVYCEAWSRDHYEINSTIERWHIPTIGGEATKVDLIISDDPLQLINSFDLDICKTSWDGFSMSFIEYLGAEKPMSCLLGHTLANFSLQMDDEYDDDDDDNDDVRYARQERHERHERLRYNKIKRLIKYEERGIVIHECDANKEIVTKQRRFLK